MVIALWGLITHATMTRTPTKPYNTLLSVLCTLCCLQCTRMLQLRTWHDRFFNFIVHMYVHTYIAACIIHTFLFIFYVIDP